MKVTAILPQPVFTNHLLCGHNYTVLIDYLLYGHYYSIFALYDKVQQAWSLQPDLAVPFAGLETLDNLVANANAYCMELTRVGYLIEHAVGSQ